MATQAQKGKKVQIFFIAYNPQNDLKKMSKLDYKFCQIKGLNVTFEIHIIAKIFDIIIYLKNEKKKIKKKQRVGKMATKGPERAKKAQIFFQAHHLQKKQKMKHC